MPIGNDWLTQGVERVGARREEDEQRSRAEVEAQRKIGDARRTAELARWSGLPLETVARNRETIERDRAGLKASTALATSPQLSRWIAKDPRNAASVAGDETSAAAISYWFGDGPDSATDAYATGVQGKPAWLTSMRRQTNEQRMRRRTGDEVLRSAGVTERANAEREDLLEANRPDPGLRSFGRGVLAETKQGFRQSWIGTKMFLADAVGIPETSGVFAEMLDEKAESDRIRRSFRPRFDERNWGGYVGSSAYGGVASLLQTAPALAAAPFTSGGSLLGILGLQSGTSQYAETRSRGGSGNEALAAGVGVGAVEAATEALPMGFLVGQFGKLGAGKFLSGFLGRELVTEQVATHVQDAIDTAIANPDKTWGEYWQERPDAAFDTMVAVGVMSGAVGSANALYRQLAPVKRDLGEATDAVAGSQFLDQAIGLAQESKMRQDDPVAFRSFIEAHTAGSPVENIYVPGEALQSFFQGSDFDPDAHDGWAAYAEQARAAAAIGGDVVMSTADAMALLSENNAWETLRDSVRLSPGGMSLEEARSIEKSYMDLMELRGSEAAAEAAQGAAEQAPGRQVYDFVLSRARGSGMSLNAAQAYADLFQARYETRAAQRGSDAWTVFQESVGDIRGAAPSAVRQYRTNDQLIQLVGVMQRGSDRAPESQRRGASLLEFIASRGGIVDRGGDIAAMGGDVWHRQSPFRRRLIRASEDDTPGMFGSAGSGYSINDHLIAALESGYFPELGAARIQDGESDALDERILLEAIGRELAGSPVYSEELGGTANAADEALRAAAEDLAQHLAMQGLDPFSMSIDEVRAALEPTDPAVEASFSQGTPPNVFEVDGVERPTRNSQGLPIARSVEAIRNFWRWFGDSKVVDDRGRPLVVFHATDQQFEQFDTMDFGSWFAEQPGTAEQYGDRGEGAQRVMPMYLRISDPLVVPEAIDLSERITVGDSLAAINEANGTEIAPDRSWPVDYEGDAFEWIGMDPFLAEAAKAAGRDGMFALEQGDATWNIFDPAQAKSVWGNSGAFDPASPRMLEQPAWHVSPHEFDQFSTDFMGTGEGAQAFGWGLYFTESDEVRRHYETAFTSTRYTLGGKVAEFEGLYQAFLDLLAPTPDLFRPFPRHLFDIGWLDVSVELGIDEVDDEDLNGANLLFAAVAAAQMAGVEAEGSRADYSGWIERKLRDMAVESDDVDVADRLHNLASVFAGMGLKSSVPTTYKVEIPDDDTLLRWDVRLMDQPLVIREAMEAIGYKQAGLVGRWDMRQTGKQLYTETAKRLGSPRAASEALLEAGIHGIKYLDGMSRRKGTGAHNFVIFDGAAVTMMEKRRDDAVFWRSVLAPPDGFSPIVLHHNGPEGLPRGRPSGRDGNYFGTREFSEMEGRTFGTWRYTFFMPQDVADAIVDLGTPESVPLMEAMNRIGYPDDPDVETYNAALRMDPSEISDMYEPWSMSDVIGPALRSLGLPGARYGNETFLLPETIERLEERRQGPDDGTVSFYQSAKTQEGDPWFYSALDLAVQAGQAKATPEQWLGYLRNAGGVKAEELEWSGLTDWLEILSTAERTFRGGAPYEPGRLVTYFAPTQEAAESYRVMHEDRFQDGRGVVEQAIVRLAKPARLHEVRRAIRALDLSPMLETTSASEFDTSLRDPAEVAAIVNLLKEWGHDGAQLEDIPYGQGEPFEATIAFDNASVNIGGPDASVTRDAVLSFLRSGGIRVNEVLLGDAKPGEIERATDRLINQWAEDKARRKLAEVEPPDFVAPEIIEVMEGDYDAGEAEAVAWEFAGSEFDSLAAAEDALMEWGQAQLEEWEKDQFEDYRSYYAGQAEQDRADFERQVTDDLGLGTRFHTWTSDQYAAQTGGTYRELLLTLPAGEGRNPARVPSTHWSQEGVVAHLRFQEKRDDQDRPVLFLEELQSDWHQKGRDEGYATGASSPLKRERAAAKVRELKDELHSFFVENRAALKQAHQDGWEMMRERLGIDLEEDVIDEASYLRWESRFNSAMFIFDKSSWDEATDKVVFVEVMADTYLQPVMSAIEMIGGPGKKALDGFYEIHSELQLAEAEARAAFDDYGIPNAPFRTTWPTLLLKRAIRWAVDNGYHSIAWTHGAEQGERYGLVNTISELALTPTGRDGRYFIVPVKWDERPALADLLTAKGMEWNAPLNHAQLAEVFGEAEADRLTSDAGEWVTTTGTGGFFSYPLEDPIKVGGEGMVEFYDRIVPRLARDLIKKHGGKVQPMIAASPGSRWMEMKRDAETARRDADSLAGVDDVRAERLYADANAAEATAQPLLEADRRLGFEITPELAEAARRGFALFQGGGDKPRGRIDFEVSGRAVIHLFENADLSTLLHESGHLWLEELRADAARPDAPQQVKDDWNTVRAWFVDNGYQVMNGTTGIPTDAHEMWARGFERYAMEGKAPTSALARAFRSFTAWLLRLYKHVDNLQTPLTDEVRSVMDRLLATQEAIDAAGAGIEQEQIFKDAAEAGMTEDEFAAWRTSISNAKTSAFEALLYRTMSAVRKRRTVEWERRREAVATEVWAEVSRRPEFRALNILRGRGHAQMPLDRSLVIEQFGSEVLPMLPRGVPPTIAAEGGFSPQLVAEAAGYRTAGEMIDALVGLEQRQRELRASGDKRTTAQEEVDRLVERAMLERFGDSLSDGSIEEEALAEIHNDQHGDRLAAELRALGRKSPRSTDAVPTPWQQARLWAERVVEEGVISEQATAAALARHQRNEGLARKAATEAFRSGDHAEAFRQKQREMYHAALYRAASRAKERVDVISKRLGKLATARKHASIHWEYLDRIQQLLEHFDFRRRTGSELRERTAFSKWVEAKRDAGEEVYVPERLLDAAAVNFMQMKFADLVALDDTIESLAHLGRRKSQLLAGQEEAQLEDVVAEAVARADALPAIPVSLQRNPEPGMRQDLRQFDAELAKLERIADYLDNGDPNGAFNRVLIQPATEAANYKEDLSQSVLRPIQETYLAMPKAQQKRLAERVLVPEFVTIDETGSPQPTDFSRMDLLAMALNIGNESNLSKMLRGESRDLPEEHAWTVEKVQAVLNRELAEEDWAFVGKMWEQVESLWPHIVRAERELTGVKPEKVVARPVQTPFGSLQGGYYPVVYDPLRSQLGRDNADELASKMFASIGRVVSTEKGHTITRTNAAAPLLLSVEGVLLHHIDKVATRIAYGRFVRDALKFTTHDDIRRLVHQRMGPEYYPLFKSWLQRQTNDGAMDIRHLRAIEKFLRGARKNVTMVGLGFRVTTMLAQIGGWTQAVGVIGEKAMVRGLVETMRNMGRNTELVFAKSGEMANRLVEFDREVRDTFRDMAGSRSKLDRIRALGFWGIINIQMHMVDVPTWWGGYLKALDGGMSDAEAIAFADKAVRQSQSSGRVKDLSEIQTGTEAHKMMTLFYSFFNAFYNLQAGVVSNARLGNWKKAAHTTFWVMMIGPWLGALLTGDWPDDGDDGELGLDDLAAWMGRKFLFGLFAGIPLARDFANGVERKVAGKFSPPPSTPIVRVWEEFETFVDDSIGLASGEDEVDGRWVQRAVTLPGYILGLPTGQAGTTARYLYDVSTGAVEPEDAGDVAFGLVKGKQPEE